MTNTILAVEDMTCATCVGHIRKALGIPGVVAIAADVARRTVAIEHEPSVSSSQLIAVLDEAGYAARLPSVVARPAPRTGCCCG
ncbi:hypothetical protein BH11MYX1_BH11MYX1_51630 [soil metagenome]